MDGTQYTISIFDLSAVATLHSLFPSHIKITHKFDGGSITVWEA